MILLRCGSNTEGPIIHWIIVVGFNVDCLLCMHLILLFFFSPSYFTNRQAAEVDGKAQHSLVKLQLFRQFYVMVVVYVYFTRIVVYVLAATIPFYLLWLGPMATELATFIFFTVTGTILVSFKVCFHAFP